MSATGSPVVSPSPNRSPSISPQPGDGSSRRRSNSFQLQSEVESERHEVLANVKETHSSQFNAVDSLSHRLETTTSSALDMFKRPLHSVVAAHSPAEEVISPTYEDNSHITSDSIVITSPSSALPETKAALGGATLVKTVQLADTSEGRGVISNPVSTPPSTPSPPSIKPVSPHPDSAETAAALTPLVEQHAEQFQTVDSLSQKLEDTTHSALDLFKRELPTVIGGRQSSETAAPTPIILSSSTPSSTSSLQASPAGVTPIKMVSITETPQSRALPSSISSSSSPSPVVMKGSGPMVVVGDDREGVEYMGGMEKDTAITASRLPSSSTEKDRQIEALSVALIQSKQAYTELIDRLYSSDIGSSLLGADARSVSTSTSSLLSTVDADDRSLQSFLHDLPVQRGWLMRRNPATANVPASYTRKYLSLSYDGLIMSDNEKGDGAEKIDISKYWLIERTPDRMSSRANYAAGPSSSSAPLSPASPMAGKSIFHLEDGAWVLRLVPIVTDPTHPHTVLEPTREQVLEFTGESEADVSNPDTLTAWVDALNLRISLLSLMADPHQVHLLARGGREVMTFLCSLTSTTLLIENKKVDVSALLAYFKEPLIHRRDFSIVLRNVGMDDAGARLLSEVLMLNHRIQHVDLSGNLITDEGASYLATSFEVNRAVVSLSLDWNEVGYEGVMELTSALVQSSVMTSLSLRGNRVADDTLKGMVDAMREGVGRVWTRLDLSWNELTDASAATVGRLLASFPVCSLNLSHNRMGDAVVAAINSSVSINAASMTALALLDLSYNRLTAHSIPALSILLSHSLSLSVKLSGNDLSTASLASLLSSGVDLTVEELRVKRRAAPAEGNVPELGRRLSITKEKVSGKVEFIDPLHPTSDKQLGRSLEEVEERQKRSSIDGDERKALEAPITAAATDMLVGGGKTADPRM